MSLKRITMNTSTTNSYEKEPKQSKNSFFHSFYNSGSFMALQTRFVFGRNSPLFTASWFCIIHKEISCPLNSNSRSAPIDTYARTLTDFRWTCEPMLQHIPAYSDYKKYFCIPSLSNKVQSIRFYISFL